MVSARTRHADAALRSIKDLEQLILLGAGLDMRPFRMAKELRGTTVFEIDLPEMLAERQRVIGRMESKIGGVQLAPERHMIAADFLRGGVGNKLQDHFAFSQTAVSLVIYEGCSMYFEHEQNAGLLSSVLRQLKNASSRLWMDYVTPAVIDSTTSDPNIHAFVDQMEMIGEKFVYGPETPSRLFADFGFATENESTAGEVLGSDDPTLGEYRFLVARRRSVPLSDVS